MTATPDPPTRQRPSRVWMDVTTSLRNRASHATGTLRVERELAAGLKAQFGDRLAFCVYRRGARVFQETDFIPGSARAPAPPRPRQGPGGARRQTLGRRIERAVRLSLRAWIAAARDALPRRKPSSGFAAAQPGDVLLLGGETWSERYDFEVIRGLRAEGVRIAAICQDIIPITDPQFFQSQEFVRRFQDYARFLLSDVDLLIAISQAVRSDLDIHAERLGVIPGKRVVIALGSDIARDTAPLPPATNPALEPDGFVIAVSTIQSRKNVDLLYRLWRRFAEDGRNDIPRLVIVGQQGFGSADLLWQIAHDPKVRANIVVLHRVDDAGLNWLYRNCRFTLYPSFAEGWGLPVSESLAYGKPCLASIASSLPEAGAGLAVHLDPLDFKAWHDRIIAWSDDPALLAALRRRIAEEYAPTTWTQASVSLANHLRGLMG